MITIYPSKFRLAAFGCCVPTNFDQHQLEAPILDCTPSVCHLIRERYEF